MNEPSAEQGLRPQDLAGIRSLLERRCGSAAVAEDLLGEALETSLRKLRAGEIARPDQLVGYVYRVALNQLRNFRRKDKSMRSSPDALDYLADDGVREAAAPIEQGQWAKVMRTVLADLPAGRDRQLLVGFFLDEEDKESLCKRLGLSDRHFTRVIYRAKERFRELLEGRGYRRGDFLSFSLFLVG